jgi:hypothetical protein
MGSMKTAVSTNQMYPALEAGWNTVLGNAATVYKNTKVPKQAPLNNDIKNSFNQTRSIAAQGVPNLDQLYATQAGILGNGGMTGTMQDSVGYLTNFANGSYQEDPRLAAAIAEREKRAMNGAATQFGGGRYGSVAIGQGMGGAMATAGNDLMLQSNENARNRQLQAAGQIGQLGTAGAQNMATWGSMSSGLNDLRYDGASRQAGIGQYLQDRTQGRNDQRAGFGWQNLGNYAGILGGMGNQGGTTISKTPGPSAAQSILGGGLAGMKFGSSIPGVGAGWGGILGAAAGAFA